VSLVDVVAQWRDPFGSLSVERLEYLHQAVADGGGGALLILGPHVAVTERDVVLPLPSDGLDPIFVVVVVRAEAHRLVAPIPGHVARRKGILEEVSGKGFVGEHGQ